VQRSRDMRSKLVLSAIALAAACARPSRSPELLGQPLPACRGNTETPECLGAIADRMAMTLMFRLYDDPAIARYVQQVGTRLVRAAGDRRTWTFRVTDEPEVNAFALPPTTVYIHRGMLAQIRDEAELAWMLAHEIAHITAGHADDAISDAVLDIEHEEGPDDIRHSRADELAADELAILAMTQAGYDPRAAGTLLRALRMLDPDPVAQAATGKHPPWTERIAHAEQLAAGFTGDRGADRFRQHMRTLVVGHDPRNLWFVDRTIVFARLGLAIEMPRKVGGARLEKGDYDKGVLRFDYGKRVIAISPIDRRVAAQYRTEQDDGHTVTAARITRRGALKLMTSGEDRAATMRWLRAALRAPRRDELARIVPTRIDFDKPRASWAESVRDTSSPEAP